MNVFIVLSPLMIKNEIEICTFEMHLKNSCFCLRPNLVMMT